MGKKKLEFKVKSKKAVFYDDENPAGILNASFQPVALNWSSFFRYNIIHSIIISNNKLNK